MLACAEINMFNLRRLGFFKGRYSFRSSELNITEADGRGSDQSLNSNASLPNVQSSACYAERSVASWAVSFERLLQDPVGVKYFTEFLKKEFSAENILFWQACERFQQIPADDLDQLSQIAGEIYSTYLSSSSLSPINIDRQAQLEEDVLNAPTSDMFKAQQLQIFNLMKFDSYTRFVKSPLYQQCVLAEVECRPLPGNNPQQRSPALEHKDDQDSVSAFGSKKKPKLKPGKSFSGISQDSYDRRGGNVEKQIWRSTSKLNRRKEKRDSLGDFSESNGLSLSRRESQGSVYSTASLELGFLSSLTARTESERPSPETEKEKRVKYCCIYLPDRTASLAMVRPGLTIRDLLSGVCERHGILLAATSVYLAGSEKKPLVLDQDSMILCDQELRVEKKILFELDLIPVNRKLWVTAKPTKTVSEALQPFLIKYNLNIKEMEAKISGESLPLKLDVTVSCLESQRVILDKIQKPKQGKGQEERNNSNQSFSYLKQQESSSDIKEAWESPSLSLQISRRSRVKGRNEEKKELYRKTYDVEALFEMLSKAQSCRANDQRGLLKKEDLVLPDFLQLPEGVARICLHPPESDTGRGKGAGNRTQPGKGTTDGERSTGAQGEKPTPIAVISTSQGAQQGDSTGQKSPCPGQTSNVRETLQPWPTEQDPKRGPPRVAAPSPPVPHDGSRGTSPSALRDRAGEARENPAPVI
ncbi:regulator of G-protein signaling 14-like isoform X2 [Heptranchias perlo]|uniref:regulator of G-protein signaling 14-like isoform X2 n=1 Tax=Heptranchias perlo TaxID=212740 RepID=UPI0035595B52